jgi:ketosteroid isomerase-like protein
VDDLQKLIAYQEIRSLMARRARCLDEKDWEGFADCYAEDAVSYSLSANGESGVHGNQAIAEGVAKNLIGVATAHNLHEPEIELLSEDSAKAIFPLNDVLSWEKDGKRFWLRGYGHYRQVYKKVGGQWRISEHRLTRLIMESGSETPSPLHIPNR